MIYYTSVMSKLKYAEGLWAQQAEFDSSSLNNETRSCFLDYQFNDRANCECVIVVLVLIDQCI